MTGKKRRIRDKARQTETYYQAGEAVADEVAEAYLAAYRSLQAEAERVFQSFAGAFSLSQAEARRLLNDYPDADARALLRRAAEAMPEGPEKERKSARRLTSIGFAASRRCRIRPRQGLRPWRGRRRSWQRPTIPG